MKVTEEMGEAGAAVLIAERIRADVRSELAIVIDVFNAMNAAQPTVTDEAQLDRAMLKLDELIDAHGADLFDCDEALARDSMKRILDAAQPSTTVTDEHPAQDMVMVGDVLRWRKNEIVEYLLENGPFDMNHLACLPFSGADQRQFAQLIGYSVDGYHDLSYVAALTGDKQ